jgi:hypothetical protein
MCDLPPRNYFGEEVGYYVAFLNALLLWLLPPALVSAWLAYTLRNQRPPGGAAAGEKHCLSVGCRWGGFKKGGSRW